MRKIVMILIVSMLMFAFTAFADEPVVTGGGGGGCPGQNCGNVNDKIKIIAAEHSFQDGDSVLTGNEFKSDFKQIETHKATGERYTPEATGGAALNSQQYYNVSETATLQNGGTVQHSFTGYQNMNNAAEIGGNCPTLNIDSANKYDAAVNVSQGANSMSGSILAKDKGQIDLSGKSLSGNLIGEHIVQYSSAGAFGNQSGSVYTHLQTNHTSPAPPAEPQ